MRAARTTRRSSARARVRRGTCTRLSPSSDSATHEPVRTGSLNASLAQWLLGSGRANTPYVARQGTALGRSGRVHVSSDDDGQIWVGGGTVTCIAGEVDL